MINQSFSSGNFPNPLKIATTIPIFKKGNRQVISNYRPISILPFLSKIFERCLYSRLFNFFFNCNLISPYQFGFLKNTSTQDAILNLIENIYSSLNDKLHSINIFIDFSKAFDTLNHLILLRKLDRYGVRGLPLRLIRSYLNNRVQKVIINGVMSSIIVLLQLEFHKDLFLVLLFS